MASPRSVLPVVRFSEREELDGNIDDDAVRGLLVGMSSKDASIRVPAENTVMLIEKYTGFCSRLLNVASNRALHGNIRLHAIFCLKTAVNRFWRNDPPIVNEEKSEIRRRLLEEFMEEEDDLVALHVSLVIGIIANYDWPRMWPELMSRLGEASVNGRGLEQLRGLMMLRYMIKSLTRKAGKGAKLTFDEEGRAIFGALLTMWKEGGDEVLNVLSAYSRGECTPEEVLQVRYNAEVAKGSLKILAALAIYGFENWAEEEMAIQFFHLLLDRFPFTLQCAEHLSDQDTPIMAYVHSYNKVFGRLLVMAQEHESRQFLAIAEPTLTFALEQIRVANHMDGVAVLSMKLVRSVITGLGNFEDYKDNEASVFLLSSVFTPDAISSLTLTLIQSYFTFTYDELEEWNDSPEQSYHNQNNSSDSDDLPRSQAELLFLSLYEQFPDIVVPFVLDLIKSSIKETLDTVDALSSLLDFDLATHSIEDYLASHPHATHHDPLQPDASHRLYFDPASSPITAAYFSLDRILLRDAALHALCAGNYKFPKHVDFKDIFVNALQKELHLLSHLALPKLHLDPATPLQLQHSEEPPHAAPPDDGITKRGSFSSSIPTSLLPGSSPAGGIPYQPNGIVVGGGYVKATLGGTSNYSPSSSLSSFPNLQQDYHQNLQQQPQQNQPISCFDYRTSILKRRICLLIAKWVTDITEDVRPMVYESVVSLVRWEEDPQVALMAVWTLECLVNEMYFEPTLDFFEPMIDTVITSIFRWLEKCEMSESQLKLLSSLGLVIEGIAAYVQPYSIKIMEMLVFIWDQTSSEILMQAALIRTFSKLVVSLSGNATEFYSHLIPVIDYATKVSAGSRCRESGLLEDGIILWLSTLRSATEFSPLLLQLFSNIRTIIDGELTDVILKLCIKLVESYILLGQIDFLQQHVDDLAVIFSAWIGDVNDSVTNEVIRPIEVLLMLYPVQMPTHFEPLLLKLLDLIHSQEESDLAMCYYLHFFNRLLLHNPDYFLAFLDRVSVSHNHPNFINHFISQFTIDKIDQLGDIRRRKIAAMALSNLVSSPLLTHDPDLVAFAVQTAIGVVCDEEAGEGPEYLVRPDETHLVDDIYITELKPNSVLSHQLELLYTSDPVNKYTGKEFLLSHFQLAQETDPHAFNHMLSLVEPLVLQSLENQTSPNDSDSEE